MSTTLDLLKFDLPTSTIIENHGYAFEKHDVTTEDGYILEMHRIPSSRSGQKPTRNYPVFIHHGLLESSADWVLGGPDYSLAMQLADDGYDIWLANCRGNIYSRKHKKMENNGKDYWDFSFNEIGQYDLPASIDYILTATNVSQLHYIGFSMGTTAFYIMASEKPEYQPKIRSQVSLAPIAYLFNTTSSVRSTAEYIDWLNITHTFPTGMIMAETKYQEWIASSLDHKTIIKNVKREKNYILGNIFATCGNDPRFFNSDLLPLIVGHVPAGTSIKTVYHYAQFITKNRFGMFDYGHNGNKKHYNADKPPAYDLKSIQVPITLMYGSNDLLGNPTDVMKLKAQLPKLIDVLLVDNPDCNHLDFLWSKNVKKVVNDPVKKVMNMTDDIDWVYKRPESFSFENDRHSIPSEQTTFNSFTGLDDKENWNSIIASSMFPFRSEYDKKEFIQTWENSNFSYLIKGIKSIFTDDGYYPDDLPVKILDSLIQEILL